MFHFSFRNVPTESALTNEYPLITSLDFKALDQPTLEVKSTPIYCTGCGSLLCDPKLLLFDPKKKIYKFTCSFCVQQNEVKHEIGDAFIQQFTSISTVAPSVPEKSEVDLAFLLDQIRDEKTEALKTMELVKPTIPFPIYVAVIDISGSMGQGKLEAVKHALIQNMHQLTAEYPATNFVLIPFSTNIQIYPTPQQSVLLEDGPAFFKEEELKAQVQGILEKHSLVSLEKSYREWETLLKGLVSTDMTALGPALFLGVSVIITRQKAHAEKIGGKILLLTDGLANVGLGSVERDNAPDSPARGFYRKVAQTCLENNIVVDVVAVRDPDGGNSVALDIIGQITDYTGGRMLFITPDQIEQAFGDLRSAYVARNVVLRVFMPEFLALKEIEGAEVLQSLNVVKSGDPIQLGAFDADREIYVQFTHKGKIKQTQKVPIQLQLEFLDINNRKKIRLYQQWLDIAPTDDNFKANFDPKVATAYELAKASKLRAKGDSAGATMQAQMTLNRNVAFGKSYAKDVLELNALVADEMDEWKADDTAIEKEQIQDQKSYYASVGQSRYRASYDVKLKRMQAKKK